MFFNRKTPKRSEYPFGDCISDLKKIISECPEEMSQDMQLSIEGPDAPDVKKKESNQTGDAVEAKEPLRFNQIAIG